MADWSVHGGADQGVLGGLGCEQIQRPTSHLFFRFASRANGHAKWTTFGHHSHSSNQVWNLQATKSEHIDEHDTCLEPLHSQGRKKGVRTCTAATPEVWRGGAGCPGKVSSGGFGSFVVIVICSLENAGLPSDLLIIRYHSCLPVCS